MDIYENLSKGSLNFVIENLEKKNLIQEILNYVKTLEEDQKKEVRSETLTKDLNVVFLEIEQPISLHNKLEYHKSAIDIHYVLEGEDTYRVKLLADCENEFQTYNEKDDFGLYNDHYEKEFILKSGQAVFIDTDMAHMALCGSGLVRKLVFKILK